MPETGASGSVGAPLEESGALPGNGNLPKEKNRRDSVISAVCFVQTGRMARWRATEGFLSGFLLHASFYLGFVRLSRCLPFFLLVGS